MPKPSHTLRKTRTVSRGVLAEAKSKSKWLIPEVKTRQESKNGRILRVCQSFPFFIFFPIGFSPQDFPASYIYFVFSKTYAAPISLNPADYYYSIRWPNAISWQDEENENCLNGWGRIDGLLACEWCRRLECAWREKKSCKILWSGGLWVLYTATFPPVYPPRSSLFLLSVPTTLAETLLAHS